MKNFNQRTAPETTENSYPLMTGWALFRPLIINPTIAQLKSLGVNRKSEDEISYVSTSKNGNPVHQVSIWGEIDNGTKVNVSIFLEKVVPTSSNGKTLYISNNSKNTMYWLDEDEGKTWLTNLDKNGNPNSKWWGTEFRKSYGNEKLLYSFLRLFINPDLEDTDEFKLDNSPFTDKGIKELREIIANKAYENNKVKVLLGVKQDKYQTVIISKDYFGLSMFSKPEKNSKVIESLRSSAEYSSIVTTFSELIEYKKPEVSNPYAVTNDVISGDKLYAAVPTAVKKDEDLPF